MAFELVYETSRKIAGEQGYLDRLLADTDEQGNRLWSERECEQLRILRDEIRRAWNLK